MISSYLTKLIRFMESSKIGDVKQRDKIIYEHVNKIIIACGYKALSEKELNKDHLEKFIELALTNGLFGMEADDQQDEIKSFIEESKLKWCYFDEVNNQMLIYGESISNYYNVWLIDLNNCNNQPIDGVERFNIISTQPLILSHVLSEAILIVANQRIKILYEGDGGWSGDIGEDIILY